MDLLSIFDKRKRNKGRKDLSIYNTFQTPCFNQLSLNLFSVNLINQPIDLYIKLLTYVSSTRLYLLDHTRNLKSPVVTRNV